MNYLLQNFENEVSSYEYSKGFFFRIRKGDVILSRSNHIRVALHSFINEFGAKGILASFQAGNFFD